MKEMSVVIKGSQGVVLDHSAFKIYVKISKQCGLKMSCYKLKKELFEVYTPFYTDSQAQRIIKEKEMKSIDDENPHIIIKETSAQRKRRKKMVPALTGEAEKIADIIENVTPNLLKEGQEQGLFLQPSKDFLLSQGNNKISRLSALAVGCGDLFQELCTLSQDCPRIIEGKKITLNEEFFSKKFHPPSLINTVFDNPEEFGLCLAVDNHQFLVPAASRFLMSTFSLFVSELYRSLVDKYDLIVLDPPWNNKSVKRKKSYQMFEESELCSLPMQVLCHNGAMICVWVTNNDRILSYVKDVVFPTWNVKWITDWFWMKVTQCGEPVCEVKSSHKKCYERIVIGRMEDNNEDVIHCQPATTERSEDNEDHCGQGSLNNECSTKKSEGFEAENITVVTDQKTNGPDDMNHSSLPKHFVVISVPCSLHSKKPPLTKVLAPFLPSNPKCLELFARNLLPGWTSWGNEVLRHQHMDYFEFVS